MHFDLHGRTDAGARTVLLSSGLGGSGAYWAEQISALAPEFRIVTYDHRGTGRTGGDVPETGGISAMADDVLEILDALDIDQVDFVGHALGGLIGLDIALRQPSRIGRLVLVNAWSKADPHSGRCFDIRIELLEKSGIPAFIKAQPLFLYPAVWMAENPERMAADEAHGIAHFQGKANILRRIAALRAFDIDNRLSEILHETLVMATKDDLLVPWTRSQRLVEGLASAVLDLVDHGGHAVNVVDPGPFNQQLLQFLKSPERHESHRLMSIAVSTRTDLSEISDNDTRRAAFRGAMAKLGAAVNIITTDGLGGRTGFAATAVCSVTDDPPTLLVCLNRSASVYGAVTTNKVLCVNTLNAGHQPLSQLFGGKTPAAERFATADWSVLTTGAPALDDALVSFDCVIENTVSQGTHDVLFCRVVSTATRAEGQALFYFDRAYHAVSS